ncbi:MAG: hypothetical protein IJM68_01110 [Synergistaceae bacterium]|nr:hypothetical protein [Synergistaceae bacterium]
MKPRIRIDERVMILREYREKVEDLMNDFTELIDTEFAPYDSRNYKEGVYAIDMEAYEYDDIDTPFMRKLLEILEDIERKLRVRVDEVEKEEDTYYEAEEMFRAWELGLCPYAMREYRREVPKYVGGAWDSSYWSEIAEFLDGIGSKREQTFRAVKTWREMKAMKAAM